MNRTQQLPLIRRREPSSISLRSTSGPMSVSLFVPTEKKEHPIRFLRPSRETRRGSMEAYMGPVGNDAKLEFYDTLIHLPRFTERNRIQKLEDTPNLAYLGELSKKKLNPEPFGIVRRKGPNNSIDIHFYGMSDDYAAAFSEGIHASKEVQILNLKANRLSDNGVGVILNRLPSKNLRSIILSENKIGALSIKNLGTLLNSSENRIKILELESTHMSGKTVNMLCEVIAENKALARLSLAKNNISEFSGRSLKEMVANNQTLKYLDLHWNLLGKGGAIDFFEGLAVNEGLKHLDLSWNSLGRLATLATSRALAKSLAGQEYLQHLDLSNNYFNEKECEIIGEGLKDNHKIYGLHMQGNDCLVDPKGYVIPFAYLNKTEQGHLHNRIFQEPRFKPHKLAKLNCWICEKWVEVNFDWKPEISGPAKESPIFLHLECDNYKACVMELKENFFTVSRMLPPGLAKFFFSCNAKLMRSKEYKTKVLDSPFRLEYPTSTNEKVSVSINKVNAIYIEAEKWSANKISIKPRNDPRIREWFEVIVEKIPWNFEKSSFAEYRLDEDEVLEQCCSYDFQVSNLKDVIPEAKEQEEVQTLLQRHYRMITEAFRQLSATSGMELFNISKNTLHEFLKKCNLITPEYNLNDIAILWNLSNAPQSKGEIYNAGNGLCRYEFAEFIVRLAIDKFFKTKRAKTIKEACEKLLDEHILAGMKAYDQSGWKTEVFMVEDVDCILKAYRPILEAVYVKYSALGKGPIETMNLHEFRMLCNEAGLINSSFVMREIDMCFRQAMMTEVDEILDGDHLEMSYVEFIEAITRVANFKFGKDIKKKTLADKLEALIPEIIKVCPENAVNGFEMPTEETFFNMKYTKKVITKTEYVFNN